VWYPAAKLPPLRRITPLPHLHTLSAFSTKGRIQAFAFLLFFVIALPLEEEAARLRSTTYANGQKPSFR